MDDAINSSLAPPPPPLVIRLPVGTYEDESEHNNNNNNHHHNATYEDQHSVRADEVRASENEEHAARRPQSKHGLATSSFFDFDHRSYLLHHHALHLPNSAGNFSSPKVFTLWRAGDVFVGSPKVCESFRDDPDVLGFGGREWGGGNGCGEAVDDHESVIPHAILDAASKSRTKPGQVRLHFEGDGGGRDAKRFTHDLDDTWFQRNGRPSYPLLTCGEARNSVAVILWILHFLLAFVLFAAAAFLSLGTYNSTTGNTDYATWAGVPVWRYLVFFGLLLLIPIVAYVIILFSLTSARKLVAKQKARAHIDPTPVANFLVAVYLIEKMRSELVTLLVFFFYTISFLIIFSVVNNHSDQQSLGSWPSGYRFTAAVLGVITVWALGQVLAQYVTYNITSDVNVQALGQKVRSVLRGEVAIFRILRICPEPDSAVIYKWMEDPFLLMDPRMANNIARTLVRTTMRGTYTMSDGTKVLLVIDSARGARLLGAWVYTRIMRSLAGKPPAQLIQSNVRPGRKASSSTKSAPPATTTTPVAAAGVARTVTPSTPSSVPSPPPPTTASPGRKRIPNPLPPSPSAQTLQIQVKALSDDPEHLAQLQRSPHMENRRLGQALQRFRGMLQDAKTRYRARQQGETNVGRDLRRRFIAVPQSQASILLGPANPLLPTSNIISTTAKSAGAPLSSGGASSPRDELELAKRFEWFDIADDTFPHLNLACPVRLLRDSIELTSVGPWFRLGVVRGIPKRFLSKVDLRHALDNTPSAGDLPPVDVDVAWDFLDPERTGRAYLNRTGGVCAKLLENRRNLKQTLVNTASIVQKLRAVISVMVNFFVFLCALAIFGLDVMEVWVAISSIILAFSFVFGGSLKQLFDSVVFLFGVHPYDVGDKLKLGLNEDVYYVRSVALFSTHLVRSDGANVRMLNSYLFTVMPLVNVMRSGNHSTSVNFQVDASTCPAQRKFDAIQRELEQFLVRAPGAYQPWCSINIKDVKESFIAIVTVSWAFAYPDVDGGRTARDKHRFILFIFAVMKRHGLMVAKSTGEAALSGGDGNGGGGGGGSSSSGELGRTTPSVPGSGGGNASPPSPSRSLPAPRII